MRALRIELEHYRDQIEGVAFDIANGDWSNSLNCHCRQHINELADKFNPALKNSFEIDDFAREHGCHDNNALGFNLKLFELKLDTAETGFKIGLLAGIIFSGCPKEQVDKYERGLAFALKSNSAVVKEDR